MKNHPINRNSKMGIINIIYCCAEASWGLAFVAKITQYRGSVG